MSELVVTNWFGDLVSHPKVVAEANSVEDIIRVLKDPVRYPSPVRAVGSNHSCTQCGAADNGTLLKMKMNRILHIGPDTLTVEAGAIHLDMAKELESRKLQLYVNTEIGSLSAGSAACAGTKDSSMPGEYGQVGSYVIGVKMVLPNGDLLEVTEKDQPELMQKVRCSYGTFGIIYEVTFQIRPLARVEVYHKTFRIEEFIRRLPELREQNLSMMYYVFAYSRKITVEFRKYNQNASGKPNRRAWRGRNLLWGVYGPRLARIGYKYLPQSGVLAALHILWRLVCEHWVKSDNTLPADQIIRYPPVSDNSRYTFSLCAFPADQWPQVLSDFLKFCDDHFRRTGYRTNLMDVGYCVAKDQKALLSYSFNGAVMTLDPVSTGGPGWNEFLDAFNQFCSDHNGAPLFNQTLGITPAFAKKAYGDRLRTMADARKTYDPNGRLLNDYFRSVFT